MVDGSCAFNLQNSPQLAAESHAVLKQIWHNKLYRAPLRYQSKSESKSESESIGPFAQFDLDLDLDFDWEWSFSASSQLPRSLLRGRFIGMIVIRSLSVE